MTIRLRLTLLFAALLGTIGLVWGAALLGGLSYTLGRIADAAVRDKVHEIADYLSDLDAERRSQASPLALTSFDALPRALSDDGTYLQLTAADGKPYNRSPNLGDQVLPLPREAGVSRVELRLPHLDETPDALMAARPLVLPGRGAVGWIQAAYPLQGHERTVRRFAALVAASWLAFVGMALFVGHLFAGRALRPVAAMTEEVRQMGAGGLGARLDVAQPPQDELDRLGATFNELFERLEAAFEAQRRFVADASHELKSPLTAILGNLQLIRRRGAAHPADVPAWAEAAEGEAARLARLVEGLLALARADEGLRPFAAEPLDLAALAREVTTQFAVVAPRVAYRGAEGPVRVPGERDRLKQLLINLVDNAVRATREGGDVWITLAAEGGRARLAVCDGGVGIAPEHQPRIFDRFFRADRSRSRAGGGTGLGLAISKTIVEDHGGKIQVVSAPGAGARFEVDLPLAETD